MMIAFVAFVKSLLQRLLQKWHATLQKSTKAAVINHPNSSNATSVSILANFAKRLPPISTMFIVM